MAKRNEEFASALNKFNLYSPEDQAAIQSVVEDYFTCREEDESEPIPELEGTFFFFFFFVFVLMEKLLFQLLC